MRFTLFLLLFLLIYTDISAQIVAPGAKLVLVDSNFAFTEGPATDKEGNIFFYRSAKQQHLEVRCKRKAFSVYARRTQVKRNVFR